MEGAVEGVSAELASLTTTASTSTSSPLVILTEIIFSNFLFSEDTDTGNMCTSPASRKLAFSLLAAAARCSTSSSSSSSCGAECYLKIVNRVVTMIEDVEASLRHKWRYRLEVDSGAGGDATKTATATAIGDDCRSSEHSYGGLKNQGCTCYMNSLLQQVGVTKDCF